MANPPSINYNLGSIERLAKYKLTYRVKITNNATGSIEFLNKARSNDTGWKTVKTKFRLASRKTVLITPTPTKSHGLLDRQEPLWSKPEGF